MGRNKIPIEKIQDHKKRRVTFIKRRIGAVRKLMQLSLLTDCFIQIKIYNKEDQSLLEYASDSQPTCDFLEKQPSSLKSYMKIENSDYNFIQKFETQQNQESTDKFYKSIQNQLIGFNQNMFFTLQKPPPKEFGKSDVSSLDRYKMLED